MESSAAMGSFYKGYSQEQLAAVFKKACAPIHTKVYETDTGGLAEKLDQVINDYDAGSIVATDDARFAELGLGDLLEKHGVYTWTAASEGQKNIDKAAGADIGLSIADLALAESGTAVMFNDKDKAKAVSLLPVASIVIVPKSVIVPRISQAMEAIENKVKAGEDISTYVNMISGPSNSADIEMRLVIGVHGPIKVAYIIVNDK
ncbi:lactate utilization protein C [Terrilactibacillus sp. S3-3]|nr:lactate utilization protein C [Terrilactibacillus sp. S3-3]